MKIKKLVLLAMIFNSLACQSQVKEKMEAKMNPLICDPVEGICGVPDSTQAEKSELKTKIKPIKIIYFTDPICSSCWGIEPQLRKLKLEYGSLVEFEYRMGGLLPDWSYNVGGISKPSDVAHHWDEVSGYYDMPIDGDIWLEDPLASSYPPSIAFKAAELQSKEKALLFLREIREDVFLKKRNIAKWSVLEVAAQKVGLNSLQLKSDMEGKAKVLFEEDLNLAQQFGVRGFPTLFFVNAAGKKEVISGSKPYAFFEMALLKLEPDFVKNEYGKSWEFLFSKYKSLTAKEFSELSGNPRAESEKMLDDLSDKGVLFKIKTKNGALWSVNK